MANGLAVINSNGDLVIADNYETYVYLGTYTIIPNDPVYKTTSAFTPWDGYIEIQANSRPICFFKVPFSSVGNNLPYFDTNQIPGIAQVGLSEVSTNVWRAYFVTSFVGGPSAIKVFVSTKSLGPSSITQGIRIRDSVSNLLFDSGWLFLNPQYLNVTLTRMQNNTSNTIGATIQFNSTNDNLGITGSSDSDLWISAFSREAQVAINFNNPVRYYTNYKIYSLVQTSGIGFVHAWPCTVNSSTFGAYSIVYGSASDTRSTVLYSYGMSTFYTS
jgi:hypothetical protein